MEEIKKKNQKVNHIDEMNIQLPSGKTSPYPMEKMGYLYSYMSAPTLACHDIVRAHQIKDINFFMFY